MRILAPLMLLAIVCSPTAVQAQEFSFTSEEDAAMQQCLAEVADAEEVNAGSGASISDCVSMASNACQGNDFSTQTITNCNRRETNWWDQMLNTHYTSLKEGLSPEVSESLLASQRAWLEFRDANCNYQYRLWGDGTMREVVDSFCVMKMTAERALELSYGLPAIAE